MMDPIDEMITMYNASANKVIALVNELSETQAENRLLRSAHNVQLCGHIHTADRTVCLACERDALKTEMQLLLKVLDGIENSELCISMGLGDKQVIKNLQGLVAFVTQERSQQIISLKKDIAQSAKTERTRIINRLEEMAAQSVDNIPGYNALMLAAQTIGLESSNAG